MDIKLYPVVEKAAGFFNIKKLAKKSLVHHSQFINPFITIAREPGSGGAPIAQVVADKLGFELIDKQLVTDVARATKHRRAVIKQLDEKTRGKIADILESVLNPEYVGEEEFIDELFTTILTYAYQGRVVILGRGANFITPFAKGLHVSITAPYPIRVQRAIEYEGHSREKAMKVIASVQRERDEFVKKYINMDSHRRNYYDLTLNTAYFGVEQAAAVIVEAFKQKFPSYS